MMAEQFKIVQYIDIQKESKPMHIKKLKRVSLVLPCKAQTKFNELETDLPCTSTIFSDNQATIAIAHNPKFHARTKHIDIAHHFL
jgi:hypothetical protein